jgi:Xaa-Pro aminopeptidase
MTEKEVATEIERFFKENGAERSSLWYCCSSSEKTAPSRIGNQQTEK